MDTTTLTGSLSELAVSTHGLSASELQTSRSFRDLPARMLHEARGSVMGPTAGGGCCAQPASKHSNTEAGITCLRTCVFHRSHLRCTLLHCRCPRGDLRAQRQPARLARV